MEYIHGNESSRIKTSSPEATVNVDDKQVSSSVEGVFKTAQEISKSTANAVHLPSASPLLHSKLGRNAQLASTVDIQDGEKGFVTTESKAGNPIEEGSVVPGPTKFSSDASNANRDSTTNNVGSLGLEKQPPSIQAMEKSDVPNPNRIPSSVFERTKSNAPMEWSVASNESLFSIHMGNSSFSRDHIFLLGRSDDLTFPGSPPKVVSTAPVLAAPDIKNLNSRQGLQVSGVTEAANAQTMNEVLRAVAKELVNEANPAAVGVPHSTSLSQQSDGSGTSANSFAFPILADGRSGSVEGDSEQQLQQQQPQPQPQPQNSKVTPVVTQRKWFSCFFCCRFCS